MEVFQDINETENNVASSRLKVNEKVWVELENQEIWPGKINSINKQEDTVIVEIYATNENVQVPVDKVFPYQTFSVAPPNMKPALKYEAALFAAYLD